MKGTGCLAIATTILLAGCTKKEEAADNKTVSVAPATTNAADGDAPAPPSVAPAPPSVAPAPPPAVPAGAPAPAPTDELAAAPPATAAPVPTDAEVEAAGPKLVGMFVKLGDAISNNARDCAVMATAIKRVTAENKDFLQEAQKWQRNPAAQEKLSEWLAKNGAMETIQKKMMDGMTTCGQDASVMSALTEMMAPD